MEERKLGTLIDIAIEREEVAYAFYTSLMEKIDDQSVKDTLEFLANEEKKHREFLINYREGHYAATGMEMADSIDYKIAEHLETPDPDKDVDSKDVYLIAAHRELQAYNFYRALAELHPDGDAKEMLLAIASQELKHKEKVEYLYANTAFPQTAGG